MRAWIAWMRPFGDRRCRYRVSQVMEGRRRRNAGRGDRGCSEAMTEARSPEMSSGLRTVVG
jgi:hypothetical protein